MDRLQAPRGTKDWYGDDLVKRDAVDSILSQIALRNGFCKVDLPTFEHSKVFRCTSKFSEEKCYVFCDKSGRELVLRPDINAPMSRIVANNFSSAPMPVKLFFSDKVFRYRHSKRREFQMFGIETFGVVEPTADADILYTVAEVAEKFGFSDYKIEFSNLQIYYGFLKEISDKYNLNLDCQKITYELSSAKDVESMNNILSTQHLLPKDIDMLIAMLSCPTDHKQSFKILEEVSLNSIALQKELIKTIDFYKILTDYDLNDVNFCINNLHGVGFYSGFTYRLNLSNSKEIADGGRYDEFTKFFGKKNIHAAGMGLGIERLIGLVEEHNKVIDIPKMNGMLISFNEEEVAKKLRPILKKVRQAGFVVEEELYSRKQSKSVNYAQSKGYKKTVFVSYDNHRKEYKINIIYNISGGSGDNTVIASNENEVFNTLVKVN